MSDCESFSDDEEMGSEPVKCLFCDSTLKSVEECVRHLDEYHSFNLYSIRERQSMSFYDFIKFINYIRKERPTPEVACKVNKSEWNKFNYMTPVIMDDPLLSHECPGVFPSEEEPSYELQYVNLEHETVTLSQAHFSHLQNKIQELTDQLQTLQTNYCRLTSIVGEPVKEDQAEVSYYFDSYDDLGIHREMIQDSVRTSAYCSAIRKNSVLFKGKFVLDVGCGSGILSLFAAQAGASKVFAVDNSSVVHSAERIICQNDFQNKITLIKSKIEDVDLPISKVDILISEWMGYCLLYEGMLDSVLDARDRFLREGGLILPNVASLHMCAVSNLGRYHDLITSWDNMYGLKLSELAHSNRDVVIEHVEPESICSNSVVLKILNLRTCQKSDACFTSEFKLTVFTGGIVTALCIYFDITFELPEMESFSTSPMSQTTHWYQSVLLLDEPFKASEGDIIEGEITFERPIADSRDLMLVVKVRDKIQTFFVK